MRVHSGAPTPTSSVFLGPAALSGPVEEAPGLDKRGQMGGLTDGDPRPYPAPATRGPTPPPHPPPGALPRPHTRRQGPYPAPATRGPTPPPHPPPGALPRPHTRHQGPYPAPTPATRGPTPHPPPGALPRTRHQGPYPAPATRGPTPHPPPGALPRTRHQGPYPAPATRGPTPHPPPGALPRTRHQGPGPCPPLAAVLSRSPVLQHLAQCEGFDGSQVQISEQGDSERPPRDREGGRPCRQQSRQIRQTGGGPGRPTVAWWCWWSRGVCVLVNNPTVGLLSGAYQPPEDPTASLELHDGRSARAGLMSPLTALLSDDPADRVDRMPSDWPKLGRKEEPVAHCNDLCDPPQMSPLAAPSGTKVIRSQPLSPDPLAARRHTSADSHPPPAQPHHETPIHPLYLHPSMPPPPHEHTGPPGPPHRAPGRLGLDRKGEAGWEEPAGRKGEVKALGSARAEAK
ncbi:unnamed protein product, partial [Gadus morhua 'NCC']